MSAELVLSKDAIEMILSFRTCDRCCHWRKGEGLGSDNVYTAGTCSNELCQDPDARYDECEQMGEVMVCGPKFGCIHWEQE